MRVGGWDNGVKTETKDWIRVLNVSFFSTKKLKDALLVIVRLSEGQ